MRGHDVCMSLHESLDSDAEPHKGGGYVSAARDQRVKQNYVFLKPSARQQAGSHGPVRCRAQHAGGGGGSPLAFAASPEAGKPNTAESLRGKS